MIKMLETIESLGLFFKVVTTLNGAYFVEAFGRQSGRLVAKGFQALQ